jgi:hypothetical protein
MKEGSTFFSCSTTPNKLETWQIPRVTQTFNITSTFLHCEVRSRVTSSAGLHAAKTQTILHGKIGKDGLESEPSFHENYVSPKRCHHQLGHTTNQDKRRQEYTWYSTYYASRASSGFKDYAPIGAENLRVSAGSSDQPLFFHSSWFSWYSRGFHNHTPIHWNYH